MTRSMACKMAEIEMHAGDGRRPGVARRKTCAMEYENDAVVHPTTLSVCA